MVFFEPAADGWRAHGITAAVEDGRAWAVDYEIDVDAAWRTRWAHVVSRSIRGRRETTLESDDRGNWTVDGVVAAHLAGCLDVDLESSAMTNAFPVHRLGLAIGTAAAAPAVYVRAADLDVGRLEQTYERRPDDDGRQSYDYRAPAFDFACTLTYDASGLLLDYPGIAVRSA